MRMTPTTCGDRIVLKLTNFVLRSDDEQDELRGAHERVPRLSEGRGTSVTPLDKSLAADFDPGSVPSVGLLTSLISLYSLLWRAAAYRMSISLRP